MFAPALVSTLCQRAVFRWLLLLAVDKECGARMSQQNLLPDPVTVSGCNPFRVPEGKLPDVIPSCSGVIFIHLVCASQTCNL